MESYSGTQTLISNLTNHAVLKGKKILHLVLKPKINEGNIIKELEDEIEKRLGNFINKMSNKLLNTKFDNPEESLKYILLKALSIILEQLFNELHLELSPHDKELFNLVMEGENSDNSPPPVQANSNAVPPGRFPGDNSNAPQNIHSGNPTLNNNTHINIYTQNNQNSKNNKGNQKQSESGIINSILSFFKK